jgi:hypothetical protein
MVGVDQARRPAKSPVVFRVIEPRALRGVLENDGWRRPVRDEWRADREAFAHLPTLQTGRAGADDADQWRCQDAALGLCACHAKVEQPGSWSEPLAADHSNRRPVQPNSLQQA